MKRALGGLVILAAAVGAAGLPQVVAAHPLGNFTVNRYSRIELSSSQIHLRYVLDLAEIPAFQEMGVIDRDHDGRVDDTERAGYLAQKVDQLRQGVSLSVNGASVDLQPIGQELSFPPGQGSLPTVRLVADLEAPLPAVRGAGQIDYRDDNFPERIGWREIVIRGGEGVALTHSNAPVVDRSAELTAYPDDMLTSPPDQRAARAMFDLVAGIGAATTHPVAGDPSSVRRSALDWPVDGLTTLIATGEMSLAVLVLAILAAFGLGALHALSPGHGKTVVGAYLVGSRGTARHALFLGLTVTITHTTGVFALGLVTLAASQYVLPEQLYPWLSLTSGLLVVAIGLVLFVTRLRAYREARSGPTMAHPAHHHPHPVATSGQDGRSSETAPALIPAQPMPRRVPREVQTAMVGTVGLSMLLAIRPAAFSQPADHGHHPAEHGHHAQTRFHLLLVCLFRPITPDPAWRQAAIRCSTDRLLMNSPTQDGTESVDWTV